MKTQRDAGILAQFVVANDCSMWYSKRKIGGVIMKRQNASKSKKEKKPPISRNPIVFETAFEKRLGQTPVDYLVNKIQGGSNISSIEYLFDIISAEIAMKNHCVYRSVKR